MLPRPAHGALLALALALLPACPSKKTDEAEAEAKPTPATATAAAATGEAVAAAPPPGSPPPDGKYERVQVEGVTVPMIQVMNGGTVILVDTDGKKPRTWEEQYKRKRASLVPGQYDIHKTDVNKNDSFEDDEIDKEGLWGIDAKGNITKH